jgi:outer membrane protein OmpA-like peptidoglycan-associated protein
MHSIRCVLIFSALSLVFIHSAFSQGDPKETAKEYYETAMIMITETKAIDDARPLMVTAADLDTTFIKANYEAGHLHLLTIDKDLAVKYLLRVYRQDPDFKFGILYWIGKSYQFGLQFDNALRYYNLYKEKLDKKSSYQGKDKIELPLVDRAIYECENGKEYVSSPGNFSILNIGREINSEFEDYAPVLNEREDEIVFTSRRRDGNLNENVDVDNKPFEDVFTAKKTGGKWGYAKNIGPIVNSPYHGSNLALSADGNTLFIYTDEGGGDIFFCERETNNDEWKEPVPLPGIINSSFEEKSITISKDERTLYFSSNRPGGFGGLDIYRATKDSKGEWSNVKNLGPVINTDVDDDAPFIDYDDVTLYFSSEGHKGMGNYDIYKSTYDAKKNEWSEPINLGYPINTPDDDVYFISSADGKRAYYSSVKEDGMGYTDIYIITIPEGLKNPEPVVKKNVPKDTAAVAVVTPKVEPKVEPKTEPKVEPKTEPKVEPKTEPKVEPKKIEPKVEPKKIEPKVEPKKVEPKVEPKKEIKPLKYIVKVINADGKAPLNAKVKLAGLKDNVIVGSSTNGDGVYEFNITNPKSKDYRLSVELEGYVFQNQSVKIEGASEKDKTITKTIELRKLMVGVSSILRNIYFDFDKASLKTESYNELSKLESMMKQNQNLYVEIGGHTDSYGTRDYNIFLSRKRAEAVKDFLVKKGIDTRRIKVVGYGKSKPLASNDDEDEGRELNRRVEFQVLKN